MKHENKSRFTWSCVLSLDLKVADALKAGGRQSDGWCSKLEEAPREQGGCMLS